jgi:hypothetical protein
MILLLKKFFDIEQYDHCEGRSGSEVDEAVMANSGTIKT